MMKMASEVVWLEEEGEGWGWWGCGHWRRGGSGSTILRVEYKGVIDRYLNNCFSSVVAVVSGVGVQDIVDDNL